MFFHNSDVNHYDGIHDHSLGIHGSEVPGDHTFGFDDYGHQYAPGHPLSPASFEDSPHLIESNGGYDFYDANGNFAYHLDTSHVIGANGDVLPHFDQYNIYSDHGHLVHNGVESHMLSPHDHEVAAIEKSLQDRGYTQIHADLPGGDKPDAIIGPDGKAHIPDITAVDHNGKLHIFEVETPASQGLEHAHDQAVAFKLYADQHGGEFHGVTTGSEYHGSGPLLQHDDPLAHMNEYRMPPLVW